MVWNGIMGCGNVHKCEYEYEYEYEYVKSDVINVFLNIR
jgi:hypothetical protein